MKQLKSLQKENESLKKKLAEAEETLHSIQDGSVDAVVVNKNNKKRIYSLENTIVSNILESITDGFISFDSQWKVIYINKKAGKTIGKKPDEIIGKIFWDVFPNYKNTEFGRLYLQSMKDKKMRFEEAYFEPLGAWFSVRMYPSKFGLSLYFQDITDRKKLEEEVQKKENKFQELADTVPVMIWITNAKGHCTYLNKQWYDYTGQNEQTGLKFGWLDAVHPDDKGNSSKQFRKAIRKKESFSLEYRLRRKDGTYQWFFDKGTPKFGQDGTFEGFIGSVTNIHDRKLAEVAIAKSKQRESMILKAGKLGVWYCDLPFNELVWDDKVKEHFFFSPKERITIDMFYERIHPADRKSTRKAIEHSIKTNTPYDIAFRTVDPTNTDNHKWIRAIGTTFYNSKNKPIRFDGVTLDITEQKILERQKDDFISIASHELKTPVTSLKAYTQVLQVILAKKGDDLAVEHLSKMNKQLDKLTDLIGDLLDVTKIEAGKIQFKREYFDFAKLVHEVAESMQLITQKHTLVVHGSVSQRIYGDRDRIGQVITNLISNAIKYSPRAGKIIISYRMKQNSIELSVQDFGLGIPKKKKEMVFERFFRVSGPNTQTFPGLGLGLYISSEIIKRQGGEIWVESVRGKGSTFYFSLPLLKKDRRSN